MSLISAIVPAISSALSSDAPRSFSLSDLDDFPYQDWIKKQQEYAELESWFTGAALDEYVQSGNKQVEKYPIRMNPIYGSVLKHAYALFGEYIDSNSGLLVRPSVKKRDGSVDETTSNLEDIITRVMEDSNFASQQMEGGIVSQIYGGTVFRVAYDHTRRPYPVRIDHIKPFEFIGIPYANDFWRLKRAWIVKKISQSEAMEYGVKVSGPTAFYIEKWTETSYEVTIDNTPIGYALDDSVYRIGGVNKDGFVPFVYIPHIRADKFWGDSLIKENIRGLVRELNSRMADAGDAVSEDTHILGVGRNIRGAPQVVEPIPGFRLLMIGSSQVLVGGEQVPEIDFPNITRISSATLDMIQELISEYRREVFVPSVAEGEDETSQRSSVTLTTRMYPLVGHIKQERVFWSTGMSVLCKMIVSVLARRGISGMKESYIEDYRFGAKWSPVLPRDRENLINELSVRSANNLGSMEHLLELTGDVENVDQQIEQIKEWMEFLESLKSREQIKIEKAKADQEIRKAEAAAERQKEMMKELGGQAAPPTNDDRPSPASPKNTGNSNVGNSVSKQPKPGGK